MARWVVLKFGGTSVSTRERWETIGAIIRERIGEGYSPLVVCSAVSGVTNDLETLMRKASEGDHEATLARIAARHRALAESLGVDVEEVLGGELASLERLALGASLTREVSPRLWARALAHGELMSTLLGAAFLRSQGLDVGWVDARDCLTVRVEPGWQEQRSYLSAECGFERDEALIARFEATPNEALLTQGFIARHPEGGTALLGRGGSDTSATTLAARLGAARCEIWTDVPGMFSANPHLIPEARLLRALEYDEAQEIASTGAKVLHPRCVAPMRAYGAPLHVLCTERPELPGTVIARQASGRGPHVKAISAKGRQTLLSMDTPGMWQQVGFLADVFACFKRHGLSIDLVSTSEMNVTVSLDPASNDLSEARLEALRADLAPHCEVRMIGPCAAVSLVGCGIRAILHRLGPALEVFEAHHIHLVSQAASDLNLTVVVDEDQAERLCRRLHGLLFADTQDDALFGPTWRSLSEPEVAASQPSAGPWWRSRRAELLALAAAHATPLYVYDAPTIDRAAADLLGMGAVDRVFYAIKANPCPAVLRRLGALGLGFECVSPGELSHVFDLLPGLTPDRVLFTPNFAPRREYEEAFERGVHVTLDNLHPLERWPEVFEGREVLVRVDPGQGSGHHAHVKTAGARSKFGVSIEQLGALKALVERAGARVTGLHAHTGSGILTPEEWSWTALTLARIAEGFEGVRRLDLGGGLGVPEKAGQRALDLSVVDASLGAFKRAHPRFELWLEPGRYLVAHAGALLARVTQLKSKGDLRYIGVDAGMNSLIRPALYGAYHEIVNLSRLDEPIAGEVNVVGPICESGDTLGGGRPMPATEEGDVVLIATAGAYGRAMSSSYNLRQPAAEHMLD